MLQSGSTLSPRLIRHEITSGSKLNQNISRKLVKEFAVAFPGSNHVYFLGLHEASDEEVWEYARNNGFTIITQDSDFNDMSLVYGYPPKVVWLRTGNVSTQNLKQVIQHHSLEILQFDKDRTLACLQVY